jgi:hypothetical protein
MRPGRALIFTLLSACSTPPPREPHPSSTEPAHAPGVDESPETESRATPAEPDAPAEDTSVHAPDAPSEPEPPPTFPPPAITPPHEASAAAGDGEWTLIGDSETGDRAARAPRVLAMTRLHPHPTSRFITTTIAAIDLSRARIHFVPGTDDPVAKPPLRRPVGLVAPDDLPRVVGVFNGGFQPKHGWWGMHANGSTLVKPRPDGCTVAITESGRVHVGPWPEVESLGDEVVSYRQTPPCLLHDGSPSPLLKRNDKVFGGKDPNHVTRRRSAVGIGDDPRVLYFAIGEEGDAKHLAAALEHAGVRAAAQLDINWNWTRFLLVGDRGDEVRITSTLLPDMNHGSREYVLRPSQRDFFYVTADDAP